MLETAAHATGCIWSVDDVSMRDQEKAYFQAKRQAVIQTEYLTDKIIIKVCRCNTFSLLPLGDMWAIDAIAFRSSYVSAPRPLPFYVSIKNKRRNAAV